MAEEQSSAFACPHVVLYNGANMDSAVGIFLVTMVAIFSAIMNLLPVFLIIYVITKVVRKNGQTPGVRRPSEVMERLARERQNMMNNSGYTASYDQSAPVSTSTTGGGASDVGAAPKVEIGSDGRPKPILG